jgi:exodeoxyribonuclease VII small subunit
LESLEDAVRRLEDGDLDLAGALEAFEYGIRHLKCCYALLEEAERRIELLCSVDGDGRARTQPLVDEATTLEEKQHSRSRRRSHPAPFPLAEPSDDNVDGDGRLF